MIAILKKYPFSILVAGLIFYMSVRPTVPDVFYLSESNKIVYQAESRTIDYLYFRDFFGHMAFYFLLVFSLFYESWKSGVERESRKMLMIAVLLPIMYGGALELIQEYFFPPRAAEWMDWFSDVLGVALAYFIAIKWSRYKKTE